MIIALLVILGIFILALTINVIAILILKYKIKTFPREVVKKVRKMVENPINRLLIEGSYFMSFDESIKNNQLYDPEFTIKVKNQFINIKLSDIIKIL